MSKDNFSGDCGGRNCDWGVNPITGQLDCDSGSGSCFVAGFLEADESKFYDERVANATRQINQILKSLGSDDDGRELSFLTTRFGVMLAWVEHGSKHQPNVITFKSDDATVAAHLGLRDVRVESDIHVLPATDGSPETHAIANAV